jgi:hypothetical protein
MRKKLIWGLVVGVIGIAVSIYAIYNMKRIANAKQTIHELSSPFSGNVAGDTAEGALMSKASQHDTTVTLLLVGGVALIVIGGVLVCSSCCKKKKS